MSVSKTRYNVKHEISQGVRYKQAKSESYSPIEWFLRSEDGHPSHPLDDPLRLIPSPSRIVSFEVWPHSGVVAQNSPLEYPPHRETTPRFFSMHMRCSYLD